MTTKHTPGPWKVVDHTHYPSFQVLSGPSFGVSVVMSATDLTFDDYLKRSADLNLMAAAPDLLAALEGLLAVSVDTSPAELLAMIAAREAIAKAKGEQQ